MAKRGVQVRAVLGEKSSGWGVHEYEQAAVRICQRYSPIPDITEPYVGQSLVWQGARYYYVSGVDRQRKPHLIEVFCIDKGGELEPVLAIHYPPPIRELFPSDCGVL